MANFDRTLPLALIEANAAPTNYDFETFSEFLSAADNADWIRAWTGNEGLDGGEYRVFGQDGTGGYAAIWLVRGGAELTEQPIVFFGSEGDVGVVARHLGDYLWLLAGGLGPLEAISYQGGELDMGLAELAARHAPAHEKSVAEVVRLAREEFPDFEEWIRALVTYR